MRKINAICVIIAMVVVLFVGCGGSYTLAPQLGETGAIVIKYDKIKDSNFGDSSYSDIEDLELDYISNSISEHGGDFDHGRFRPIFYDLPIQMIELVGRDVYRAWHSARCAEEFLNENVAVSFIRYFNISREDFERANYEMYRQNEYLRHGPWAGMYPSPVDSFSFELYPVDLIFSFDNERINEFFRWENSPRVNERWIAVPPKRVINSAAINVTTPLAGLSAEVGQPEIDWSLNYVVRSITWSPDIMPFAANTTYTVTAIISARTGYTLEGLTTATINGRPAVISNNTGITARISYTFTEPVSQ